ncbi:ABC transporter ATP-binding protein [Pseudanabaena sp. SR411]|uniref:ABC transporter ATP-binding protein n=1 Tax=Pseudanabaena sp. SR411 TaxID=1980935 RepID=UPI000B97CE88|nr:ABC transporter ATP-binding protein [Pseudanabaena sp. SR411]OYQ63088.1 ABC transporter ATP-binding protein [Pseudanabaena sp. SR411]
MLQFFSKLLYIIRGYRKGLLLLLLLFFLLGFMESASVGLIGPFIAIATDPTFISKTPILQTLYQQLGFASNTQFLQLFGLCIISFFYLKIFIGFRVTQYVFAYGFTFQGRLSLRLLHSYLAAPYTFHLKRNTATLIQCVLKDTETFCNGLLMPLLTSISNIFVTIGLVILLIATSPIAVILISLCLLFGYATIRVLKDRLWRWGKDGSDASTEIIRTINHSLGGIKETRIIGCEQYFEKQLEFQTKKMATSTTKAVTFSTFPRYLIEGLFMTFLVVFTLLFLLINREKPQMVTSVLGIFALASFRLMPAVGNLLGTVNGVRYNSYVLDKLYLDLKEQEELDSKILVEIPLSSDTEKQLHGKRSVVPFLNEIILEKITYRYPDVEENALNEISLTIKRGQSIGLIGRSGAGKTTLVDVILGLLTPQSGDIQVDGKSIYQDLRSWQNLIGYVPQSIFLTDDTLERNIAFGVPDHLIDAEKLQQAIQSVQLSELVEQLPDGIQTVLGERGVRLSGGQRQRVGIARALYHQRELLVLDEATAALDNETESLVSDAIKALGGNKTIIIIAHRLSTIQHCDRIYKLERGRILQSGSYEEVVLEK